MSQNAAPQAMTERGMQIAERFTRATMAWNAIQMRNVAGLSLEDRIKLDVDYAKASAEYNAAARDYNAMIDDMATAS